MGARDNTAHNSPVKNSPFRIKEKQKDFEIQARKTFSQMSKKEQILMTSNIINSPTRLGANTAIKLQKDTSANQRLHSYDKQLISDRVKKDLREINGNCNSSKR